MVDKDNPYTNMQRKYYESGVATHLRHNKFPHYWDILLGDLKDSGKWKGKNALDFGCGAGRNVINMATLCEWDNVDGCDISAKNIELTRDLINAADVFAPQHGGYVVDGISLRGVDEPNNVPLDFYDFIMSTITLQHICVYDIRFKILEGMYACLREGGLLSIQMGFKGRHIGYYENNYDAKDTNSKCDVIVSDPKQIVEDLEKIGFKEIHTSVTASDHDGTHPEWIFAKGIK
jgi:SAM-dependent methyltransferase